MACRVNTARYWQFKNGTIVLLGAREWFDMLHANWPRYSAWDRRLGARVYYAR